jgi:hypothetical protein
MPNRRQIGARAERAWAKYLSEWLDPYGKPIEARRGQQYQGGPGSPDVVTSLPEIHFEVCRDHDCRIGTQYLERKLQQAERDCGGKLPVVIWKAAREPWRASVRVEVTGYSHRSWTPLVGTPNSEGWQQRPNAPATMLADDFLRLLGCRREESTDPASP